MFYLKNVVARVACATTKPGNYRMNSFVTFEP